MQPSRTRRNLRHFTIGSNAIAHITGALLLHMVVLSTWSIAGTLKLYWSDGVIHRANLDGTQSEDLVPSSAGEQPNVAIDPIAQKIYWPSQSNGGIERANYDGTDIETAINGIAGPRKVAVDSVNRKAYWLDYGSPNTIWRSNLDGSGRELLYSTSSLPPLDIVVDPSHGYYYWSSFQGEIHRTSLDGSVTTAVTFAQFPSSLAIDPTGGYLYASDSSQQAIIRMGLDLSNPTLLVTQGVSDPIGIAIDPLNGRVIWANSQLTAFGRNFSSIKLDGTDLQTNFFTESVASFPPAQWTYLAIAEIPTPEPASVGLACIGGIAMSLILSARRRKGVRRSELF